MGRRLLGVAREPVAAGAAGKIGAAGGMRAGQRAPGNAVAVDVIVTAKVDAVLELFGSHHLAAIVAALIVPGEGFAQMRIHADVEVEHDEHRRLQALGEIEGGGGEFEDFAGCVGDDEHVFGVAMTGEGGEQDVRLLGARRHARRRPAALDVEHHHGDLGEIGEAEKLLHQRDARSRGRRQGARAVSRRRPPCRSPRSRPPPEP